MQFNKVILAGNITRAPELRFTESGTALCKFGVATNETYVKDGEQRQKTTFVDLVAWGTQGETIHKHFGKGKAIFIEGRLEFSSWEKDGVKRSKLEVKVDQFRFVGKKEVPAAGAERRAHEGGDVDLDDIPF